MTTDNQAFDLVAADGLRLSFTPIRDWTMLHPELRGTPFQVYAIMRSLVFEKAGDGMTRRLTRDQLCYLVPGINGKPTSLGAVRDALKVLAQVGLITNPDGERVVTSTGKGGVESWRRFQINDYPPENYQGWRNAWDKLANYSEDWRINAPMAPTIGPASVPESLEHPFEGRNSDPRTDLGKQAEAAGRFEGQNSDHGVQNSVNAGQNSVRDAPLTSQNEPSNKSLKKGSLSTVATEPPEASSNADGEREPVFDDTIPPDPAAPIVQAWVESWVKTHNSSQPPIYAPNAIRNDARQLLTEGMDVELLCLAAADMATHDWNDLRKHLRYWKPPSTTMRSGRTAADCRWCDAFGWYEHTNGRDARCNHPDDPPAGHPAADARSAA